MRRISLAVLVLAAAVAASPVAAQSQDPVIVSARQFAQQGNHDTAIAMLRSSLTARPNDAALKNELVSMLVLKEAALRQQLDDLAREITSLRGAAGRAVRAGTPVTTGCSDAAVTPVRIGGIIKAPMKTRNVKPTYPIEAQQARLQGIVIVEAAIDCEGNVAHVRVLRGQPLLNDAAVDAVRQWRYRPTLLNGLPVPVIMTATVTFTIQQ